MTTRKDRVEENKGCVLIKISEWLSLHEDGGSGVGCFPPLRLCYDVLFFARGNLRRHETDSFCVLHTKVPVKAWQWVLLSGANYLYCLKIPTLHSNNVWVRLKVVKRTEGSNKVKPVNYPNILSISAPFPDFLCLDGSVGTDREEHAYKENRCCIMLRILNVECRTAGAGRRDRASAKWAQFVLRHNGDSAKRATREAIH